MKVVEKLYLGRIATPLSDRRRPVYNWFSMKEAFSRDLVFLLAETWGLGEGDVALDPFCGCYDSETEVLTKKGWKRFDTVTVGDEIATLNPATFELEYQRPRRLYHYIYRGKMYKVKSKQVDLLVTPNHRMFVAQRKSLKPKSEWIFDLIPAESIFGKHVIYKKNCKWRGVEKATFELGNRKPPMDDWLFFFGLWLAGGSVTKYRRKNGKGYFYVVQIRNYNDEILSKAVEVAQRLGFNPHLTQGSKVKIYDKELYEYLSKSGKSREKFIPDDIKSLSPRQLELFLNAYLLGDGRRSTVRKQRNPTIRCWTASEKLKDDLQEIALKAGWSANFALSAKAGEKDDRIPRRQIFAGRNTWMLTFIQKHDTPRVYGRRSVRERSENVENWVDYNGDVWCLEVPNHVIYVRRNGKPVWCGNSGTAPLACRELGLPCVGFDVHPVLLFASRVKLGDYDVGKLRSAVHGIVKSKFERMKVEVPALVSRVFPKPVLEDIAHFRGRIMEVDDEKTREFMLLGLAVAAMRCSWARRDGAAIKVVKRAVPPLRKVLEEQLLRMCRDLEQFRAKPSNITIEHCDARKMNLADESVDAVITSPPYFRKQEYIHVYRVEGWILGLEKPRADELIGVREGSATEEDFSDVTEFVGEKPFEAKLYFKDMFAALREISRVCKKGAGICMVTSDGCLPSGPIEVCETLSSMAEKVGFRAKQLVVVNKRYCTTPARRRVGISREALLMWEKTV
ncbi:MAG TPA: hypothetical protein EYP46_00445 [Hadesarchaea archaeon]|nr:hypothetical protein [Hadesarchaea archaeon]